MPNVNEYMLKQADAEAIYQKKLTAGTGISIDPLTDTISATGSGGSTVTYTPNVTTGMILGILGINGTSNPIKSPSLIAGQNVSITQDQTTGALTFSSVNTTYNDMVGADGTDPGTHGLAPAPAATDNTKFLKGDGSWGDPVTANPVATATATLTKLSINNIVYDLAGGGTATYFGTTDPSNSLGNNGDLYFKYISVPAVIEDEVTLPTFVDDQSTHVTVPNFENYTDVSFGYIDIHQNPGTKDFTIEDLPQNNDPQWSQGGDIYIVNGWFYAVASRDSTGFWIKECGNPLQSITISYSGYSYNIISTYVKIEGRWIAFSTGGGGGSEVIANPSGTATDVLNKIEIDDVIYSLPSGGGGGTGSFVGLTKSQYDALPTSEKEDASKLYLVQEGGSSVVTEPIDLSGGTTKNEYSMTITKTSTTVTDSWNNGSSIGAEYRSIAIDVTDVDELTYELVTTTCYGHDNANVEEQATVRFQVQVCLFRDISYSGWMSDNMANAITYNTHKYTNTTYTPNECKIDTSSLTGVVYVVINMHGWNLTFSNLSIKYVSSADIVRHTYWNNAKWSQWNQVKELTQAQYNALTTAKKTDGSIYMTHDGGYDFINYDNGKIIVRINSTTRETIWYFNGYTKEAEDIDVPTELVPYIPTQTYSGSVLMCWAWTDDTSTTRNGAIGFVYPGTANVKLRSWNNTYASLMGGTFWGTLIINGAQEQQTNYSAPTEGLNLLPNRIYYNNTLYADNATGGSAGGNITLLASPPSGSTSFPLNTNITLAEDMTHFDCIMFCPAWSGGPAAIAYPPAIYPVAYFKALTNRAFTYYASAGYNDVGYVDDTTVQFFRNSGETVCNAIYGIKY